MIGVADAEACGIPFKELSTFRDYVRNHYEGDLTTLPPEIKFGIVHKLAAEFIEAKEERTRERQTELRQSREVAADDRRDELERHRSTHPGQKLEELQPDPEQEGAVPSPLPEQSGRRRRRRRSARP